MNSMDLEVLDNGDKTISNIIYIYIECNKINNNNANNNGNNNSLDVHFMVQNNITAA